MSVVVYEGDGGYEGTLFNGLKFWVSVKVPQRESFVNKLKNNGGKIVLLEQFADVKIADHMLKTNAPEDSVSWKWIDACIREGGISDIDKYKIKTVKPGRPGVSSTGPKGSRTKFTNEDDKILVRWVVQHEAAGEKTKGNEIYYKLAASYPHHTSQSWRDRWIKRYQDMPRKDVPYLNDPDSPPPPTAQQSSVTRPAPSAARLPTGPVAVSSSVAPRGQSNTPKKRVGFTEEDDKILKRYVFERVHAGEKALGNKIYMELEGEYPHHTFQSWLDRAKRKGFARDATDSFARSRAQEVVSTPTVIMDLDADAPPTRSSVPITKPKISVDAQEFVGNEQATRSPSRTTEGPAVSTRSSVSAKSTVSDRGKKLQGMKKIRAAKLIQRVWRGYRVRRDLFQELDDDNYQGYLLQEDDQVDNQDDHHEDGQLDDEEDQVHQDDEDENHQEEVEDENHQEEVEDENHQEEVEDENHQEEDGEDHHGDSHGGTSPPPPQPHSKAPTPRQTPQARIKREPNEMAQLPNTRKGPTAEEVKFYKNLFEFYDYESIHPIKTVEICIGEPVVLLLWELWTKATADHSSHECRRWEDIATALGIDWVNFPDVTNQLKSAFDKHLLGYEVRLKDWKERFADEDGDEDEENDESDQGESSSDGNSRIAAPPRVSSPSKGPDLPSSPPIAGLKRTLDRTRDSSETTTLGPSAKRRRFNPDDEIPCSPEVAGHLDRLAMRLDSSPQLLPLLPRPLKKVIEPETQDFNFDNMGDDPLEVDLTPSQQLRSEMSHQHRIGSPDSDSSDDAFDPPMNQSRPCPAAPARPSIVRQEPRRRVLPLSYSKTPSNKPPANTNQQPVGSHRRLIAPMSPTVQARPAAQPQRKSTPADQRLRETPKASSPARLSGQRPRETAKVSSPPRPTVTFIKYPSGLEKTVEHYMALGYPEGVVLASLEATTFVTGEAAQLMESLKAGRGIPRDVKGVWTDEDNGGLLLLDLAARGEVNMDDLEILQRVMEERERLIAKHESKRVFERTDYLGLRMWG